MKFRNKMGKKGHEQENYRNDLVIDKKNID